MFFVLYKEGSIRLFFHQFQMGTALFDFAFFHIIDRIRINDVFKTMRYDNDRFYLAHRFDVFHDNRFAFNVDIARCLIKDIDVFIRNKINSQRQSLFLPAR